MQEDKISSVLLNKASYIIATEFCERLAYYGFAGSLVLFFETKLDYENEDAINQFYVWNGMVYLTPLLGGYIADTYLGRFKTILYFSIVYIIGLGIFLIGAIPTNLQVALIFLGMYVVALGAGGIKPNASTMGADQFDMTIPQDKNESKLFFSYFYWSINLGALVSYTLVAYICQYGISFLGGEDWGFFIGYLIPTMMLAVGLMIFYSGSKRYKKNSPEGSIINQVVGVFYEACILRRHIKIDNHDSMTEKIINEETTHSEHVKKTDIEREINESNVWLDRASSRFGGSYDKTLIQSIKYIVRLSPFLLVMIPYWGIYGQTKTAFQIQGCQMNVSLGSLDLPVSAMNIFNNVSILILVPLFERYLYPFLKAKGYEISMLQKIGIGFIFAILAMLAAAIIEYFRQEYVHTSGNYYDEKAKDNISPCRNIDDYNPYEYVSWYNGDSDSDSEPANCNQVCDFGNSTLTIDCVECDDIPQRSSMSILWQVPLFILIGISEIFASITSLEFFYSQAPNEMRSVSQASNLFTNAMGSWLTIPLTLLVNVNSNNKWIPSDLNNGHLDWYFYLLASIMSLAFMGFVYISYGYVYVGDILASKEALTKSDIFEVIYDNETSFNENSPLHKDVETEE